MTAINPLYSVAGLLVGLLVGLTGVGGGSLMTPLLVLLFNFHPSTAVGTDLLYASMTKSVGTAVHGARATVNWTIVKRLAAGSVPASLLTLWFLYWIGKPSSDVEVAMKSMLGATLMLTALAILFQTRIVAFAAKRWKRDRDADPVVATILLGGILGILVSMTSVGAGAIGVTMLLILYPDLSTGRIVGSDIAHAVPLTMVAGLGHWAQGNVDPLLLVSLLIGSVPGIVIGSLVGSRAPDRLLRPALAITLMVVGFTLVH